MLPVPGVLGSCLVNTRLNGKTGSRGRIGGMQGHAGKGDGAKWLSESCN